MAQAEPDKTSILDLDNSKIRELRALSDRFDRVAGLEGSMPEFADLLVAARELRNLATVLKAAGEDTITIELQDDDRDLS